MKSIVGVLSLAAVFAVACFVVQVSSGGSGPVHRTFHVNGRIETEWRVDAAGRRHGEERCWDEAGTLRMFHQWSHGEIVRQRVFDADGDLIRDRHEGPGYLMPIGE